MVLKCAVRYLKQTKGLLDLRTLIALLNADMPINAQFIQSEMFFRKNWKV